MTELRLDTCTEIDASVIFNGGNTIASSFRAVPPTDWLVSDIAPADRPHVLYNFFDLEIERILHGGHGYVDHLGDQAFAVWESAGPDLSYDPLPDYDERLQAGCGEATPKFQALGKAFAEHHPTQTTYEHLHLFAVRPDLQGTGLGGQLLQYRLDQFDELGRSAFLETTTAPNVRWYKRFGFHVLGRSSHAPDLAPYSGPDGTIVSPLWRGPKT